MIGGMFGIGQCDRNAGQEDRPVVEIAKIGGQVVDYTAIRDLADQNIQQSMMGEEGLDPAVEGRLYANVTQSVVTRAIIQQVAAERNITVDDAELRKKFEESIEVQV